MILKTPWLPSGAAAMTPFNWLILVKPAYINDAALIAHEQTHIAQRKRIPFAGTLVWWARYALSKQWRMQYEIEAYRVQIASPGGISLVSAAYCLSTMYRLDISFDRTLAALTEEE